MTQATVALSLISVDTGDGAFRQHEFGHTPAPDWPYFIVFADKELTVQK